ncbi:MULTISPECIES: hypothetical protein [Nostoc]|uniref:Uncharacterized protein n=1 Tax=Nostoc paludosum FACHB-159 TaxID=2692908 RepID=A0ABR8KI14_9NOSO|nr:MULTISPECIES: hypothetical protein [Nostoc]MBD2682851.1 hypothetical protein [Nostoc sp. FACHB-857]MBD2739187.1 hypothetical protein [Nostoc paludosum FACHB-159]
MKSLHLIKKVVAFVFIVFSLSLMFQNYSFAQAYSLQTQDSVYLLSATSTLAPPSSSTTPQLEKIEWQITSVPIRPLLPGKEWEAETIENGNQLLIKHGGEEALTLLSSANSQLEKIEWEITSVPIRPLLPGKEWEAETIENGNKLVIKHGNEEALTLVRKQ